MRSNPSRLKKTILVAVLFCSFLAFTSPAYATPVSETASVPQTIGRAITKLWDKYKDALQKAGSRAFQSTVRSALNKIAYDTATYVGSGGKGQKPLFVTKNWGSYLEQIGDEAAGQFIEDFASSFASDVQADQARERGEKNCDAQ
ncbi:MAG: hypothetical protein PHR57_03295, partial [Patescibacteria group bacterium]|nr:hypothetical protein [Patescibacteria group bacterium]